MTDATTELVREVCTQYSQDGIVFTLLSLAEGGRTVELGLELDGVECMDCVMPTPYLERMIASSLSKRMERPVDVRLRDPRLQSQAINAKQDARPARVTVLDPTASGEQGDADSGPDAGTLVGKTVLFRTDVLWESWDWIVDEWQRLFGEVGVQVRTWRRSQGSWGDEARRLQTEYEGLIRNSHVLVSGLGNCGSCSVSTVQDALSGLTVGKPTLTVVTSHFRTLAHLLAENAGRSGLRIFELPHPLSQRPEHEIREIAREYFPSMLKALGATV
jgi:hypothetical protein